ncbi:MAG: hypothetical protein B7C24_09325 [Bacteroidetes bacterium 4572_77]|nr:MAG: hypothetical protein B7C24_09325 [Bacteroidetes bacterium 4572_77]
MLSLEKIYEKFEAKGDFLQASELNSGHINNTYLVETKEGKPNYVLQQINHKVFPDIPALMQNKILVSQYLKNNSRQNQVHLQFIKAYSGQYFYKDQTDYYWNMMEHIPNSKVLEKTENTQQAKEAGRGFGGFISALHNFDASQLHEVIKDFHKMSFRFEEFDHALKNAQTSYKDNAKKKRI